MRFNNHGGVGLWQRIGLLGGQRQMIGQTHASSGRHVQTREQMLAILSRIYLLLGAMIGSVRREDDCMIDKEEMIV